jgi:peroxiredoxin
MKCYPLNRMLYVFLLLALTMNLLQAQTYEIKVKFDTYRNNTAYLGFHYGNNKYIRDTAQVNNKGIVTFKNPEGYPGGIYLVIIPDKNHFELIVSEKKVYVETDTSDYIANMKIISSKENEVYNQYLLFMREQQFERENISQRIQKIDPVDTAKISKLNKKLIKLNKEALEYRKKIIKDYPDLFFSKLLTAIEEPVPRGKMEQETDSMYRNFLYGFYQNHYFDNIDLSDKKFLRTPIYEAKVDRFVDKLTMRHPDSIKYAAQRIIDRSMANEEVFRFTLSKLFNKYARSKYMGMDAVVVYLAEQYYLSGKATWADSAQIAKIYERIVNLSSNLIGMKAPELIMQDMEGKYTSLHSVNAVYTVLVFWDVSCSHCRQIMPQIKKLVNRTPKDSLQVMAVYVGKSNEELQVYLKENPLPFIHVSDPNNFSNYRTLYDVYSTPIIYLLDKNKIIQAKRIGADKIEPIINTLEERYDLVKPTEK